LTDIQTKEGLATLERVMRIFLPYAFRSRDRVRSNKGRFVHYTSAENALKIINTKFVWLRNTTCMTDYREVNHGFDALNRHFANANNKEAFVNALNECSASIAEEAIALFDQWLQSIRLQTYISSISEHDDREDFMAGYQCGAPSGTPRLALALCCDCHWKPEKIKLWRVS
jgi:hypothetical protein